MAVVSALRRGPAIGFRSHICEKPVFGNPRGVEQSRPAMLRTGLTPKHVVDGVVAS